jgi:hypothetical protein
MSDGDAGKGPSPGSSSDSTSSAPPTQQPLKWQDAVEVIRQRKVDAALWVTRFLTIIFSVLYLLPIFGPGVTFYHRAFLANAATSALRLHQRLPRVSFTREFMAQLISEDSCHYLFYSLIFIYCAPITLAILPVLLFAVLHFASFSLTLLDALGRNSAWIARLFISLIEFQTVTILRMAAGAEIFTMVFVIAYTFMGRASLLTPFIYYRFLTLRYASRRNHYSRTMFYELKITAERIAASPKCPGILSATVHRAIGFISQLAPAVTSAAQ